LKSSSEWNLEMLEVNFIENSHFGAKTEVAIFLISTRVNVNHKEEYI